MCIFCTHVITCACSVLLGLEFRIVGYSRYRFCIGNKFDGSLKWKGAMDCFNRIFQLLVATNFGSVVVDSTYTIIFSMYACTFLL